MNHHKEPKIEPSRESSAMASHSSIPKTDLFQTEEKSLKTQVTPNPPKGRKPKLVDDAFIEELKRLNPDKDVEKEAKDAQTWLLAHPERKYTRAFLTAWVIRSKNTIKPTRFADF
jgi:hypothetical protein